MHGERIEIYIFVIISNLLVLSPLESFELYYHQLQINKKFRFICNYILLNRLDKYLVLMSSL